MTHDVDALRDASERAGIPFDYLQRLAAAEDYDPQDPGGNNTLAKQLTIVFDHHVAKCLADADPIAALRRFGFDESAEALAKTQRQS
ncbi:hypothetical protein [Streptomyces capitiformicae]|uniref:Uncharacterized protein n=1 Tax=Streptomyces capitiformicae TaxID=2014920 RepID=A0A919GNA3_9ACTN|nr:hypothetical protein [Streptomyces capitiformicae]GHH87784.1 hypothetical protein GCM10017771_30320 [Streptomyces capitiformicae]